MNTLYFLFGIAVLALVCAVCLAFSGVRTGGRLIPKPPEHLRPKKNNMPIYENPPAAPKKCVGITPHGKIYKDDFDFPNFPTSKPSP